MPIITIPVIRGVKADTSPQIRAALPVNMVPIPSETGAGGAVLSPAKGIKYEGTGAGEERGGIEWNGVCYRVMGTRLMSIDDAGVVTDIGDVGAGGRCSFTYSFDRLAISSGGGLYYYNGTAISQVTDPDIGNVLDVTYTGGYFVTHDGESIIVTELTDPMAVNPLKYGSSEVDPDPIVRVLSLRNELVAVNRHTIEYFSNVGGDLFPFQRVDGAQVTKGAVGKHACCLIGDSIAFLGSGRNESIGLYIAGGGQSQKVSTPEVDRIISEFSEAELSGSVLEYVTIDGRDSLYLHLPDRCIVLGLTATKALQEPAFHVLTSALVGFEKYRAISHVWCYGRWLVADTMAPQMGRLVDDVGSHWGTHARIEFGTPILSNSGASLVVNMLELVALSGSVAVGSNATISSSHSSDGIKWSQKRTISVGGFGHTGRRLAWFSDGLIRNWRVQKFEADTRARIAILSLRATVEVLQ